MMKLKQVALVISIGMLMSVSALSYADVGLTSLSDDEMAKETGQALFNLSYIAPGTTGNTSPYNSGVGFYKLGMEATVELNANIKKLQLGCGGRNGAGACDIDIDNLSLSGLSDTSEGRVGSSAVLTNPFIQFAIKNPQTASTREIVGMRVSAEDIVGLLTTGVNDGTPNGINTLSGYLVTKATTGTTYTKASDPGNKATRFGTSAEQILRGALNISAPLCTSGCGRDPYNGFTTDPNDTNNTGLIVPSLKADFAVPSATVTGNRLTSATIQGVKTTSVQNLVLDENSGQLKLNFNDCVKVIGICASSEVTLKMQTTITGISADINFAEKLGYIHKLPLSGGGFYLALQNQQLSWPGAAVKDIAQPGWWMSFAKEVDLGVLNTPAGFTVDFSSAYPAIANALSVGLYQKPTDISMSEALSSLSGQLTKNMGTLDLSNQPPALINLADVPLSDSAQKVVPNCYGGLTFC